MSVSAAHKYSMIYQVDYFGFVYEWFDQKTSMRYIGSHHGSITSSYKGSNIQFQRAIKKRPNDFTRKILEFSINDDKTQTLLLEQKWLDSIGDIRNNPMYYNQKNEASGGWSFITPSHIQQRSASLKAKHKKFGLNKQELESYKTKIETRLKRIADRGFTEKEKDQHSKYGCEIKVIDSNGREIVFSSLSKATKFLGFDAKYGLHVCKTKESYRGHKIIKLRDPIIDCRTLGNK